MGTQQLLLLRDNCPAVTTMNTMKDFSLVLFPGAGLKLHSLVVLKNYHLAISSQIDLT